jgi:hypothetical protein
METPSVAPLGRLLSRFVLNPFARTLLRDAIKCATGERPPLDDHPVADSPAFQNFHATSVHDNHLNLWHA